MQCGGEEREIHCSCGRYADGHNPRPCGPQRPRTGLGLGKWTSEMRGHHLSARQPRRAALDEGNPRCLLSFIDAFSFYSIRHYKTGRRYAGVPHGARRVKERDGEMSRAMPSGKDRPASRTGIAFVSLSPLHSWSLTERRERDRATESACRLVLKVTRARGWVGKGGGIHRRGQAPFHSTGRTAAGAPRPPRPPGVLQVNRASQSVGRSR